MLLNPAGISKGLDASKCEIQIAELIMEHALRASPLPALIRALLRLAPGITWRVGKRK